MMESVTEVAFYSLLEPRII